MKFLVCSRLSEHRYKTPEGYLVCVDSILSRTGKQTYSRDELFKDGRSDEVEVERSAEEVFSEKTLASFENKPLTIEHPEEDVTPANHNKYSVGFIRDVKRGKDGSEDVMLGTIVVTDAEAIELIETGKLKELSCGYDCDIEDEDNPQQRNIRGNHVALCEHGRAGIARIVDSVKDAEQIFRVLATVPGDYDDEPGFDIIFNVKANSENEAIEKAKKYAEKTPAYRFAWAFRLAEHNQRARIERNVDSVKDEQLYAVEFTYNGDSWSDYLGHVNVRAKSEQEALTKAKRWAREHYDNPGFFKIASTKYTNVETIDVIKDAKYVIMHPRKNLYLTVGAKTWSDESSPMIKKFDSEKEAEEYAKKNTSDFRIAAFDSVKDAMFEICYIDNGDVCVAIEAKDENDARQKFHRRYGMYYIKHIRKIKDGVKDMKHDAADLSGLYKNDDGDAIKVTRHGLSYDVQFGEDTISNTGWSYPRSYDSNHLQRYLKQNRLTKVSKLDYLKDSVKDCKDEDPYEESTEGLEEAEKNLHGKMICNTETDCKDEQFSELGDKVRFRNRVYVIIKVQKSKSDDVARLTLRPLERFDEKDKPFDGGGDSYWDIHIERWQLDDSCKEAATIDVIKDAKTEYVFNYHDTYQGTRDKMRVDANNLDEAIREFGKTMALGGFGTANIYVVSVSPNDGYMRAYGKLSEMLKQKWTRDSAKKLDFKKLLSIVRAVKSVKK